VLEHDEDLIASGEREMLERMQQEEQAREYRSVNELRDDLASRAQAERWASYGGKTETRIDNPPMFVRTKAEEARWERAKAIVRPRWHAYDSPWSAVVKVYYDLAHIPRRPRRTQPTTRARRRA